MKIKVSNIEVGDYSVRDEFDEEHVKEIADSFEKDGQWNPIIVRPGEDGKFNLIAGHYRLEAAKRLGWDEIEATVRDTSEEEADVLALKTNLMRESMSQVEEGKVLQKLIEKHEIPQSEIAERFGKSQSWVEQRLQVAFDLHEQVAEAVNNDEISFRIATLISRLDNNRQPEFLNLILERNIKDTTKANELKRRFDNDTIYTIGYTGREWGDFSTILKNNDIEILVDTRKSAESQRKPEFNGDVVANRLENEGIDYTHMPELGVDYLIQEPYKDGWIGDSCFEDWYQWWIREKSDVDITSFVAELEETGRPAIMCVERYPDPMRDQDIYCHRHFLAGIIQSVVEESQEEYSLPNRDEAIEGRQLFPNRMDL